MKTFTTRGIATSLTTLLFLVIGISGVMMFFRFFDDYVKDLHEILGLVFVAAAILHVIVNFSQMKRYFTQKVFISSTLLVAILSLGFIYSAASSKEEGIDPKRVIIGSVFNAPLNDSLKIMNVDFNKAAVNLQVQGIDIQTGKSIIEIAKKAERSPFDIVRIINK
ncbi:MAG: DUF4405 domain-containing protein [Campylobacterales bacterium]|nr:DUF4405 domain-containing protein [Campylobacterales bacterium]